MKDEFSGPWKSPEGSDFITIGRALVKNNERGCGEYKVKKNTDNDSEYLVACTSNGKDWFYHLVNIHTETVSVVYDLKGVEPAK